MNVGEMHTGFKIGVDKIDSLNYAGVEPEEIDFLLNQAQDRFVKTRYGRNNIYKKGFEETQKRTDDIRTVVRDAVITPDLPISSNKPFGQFVALPNDSTTNDIYWFAVQEEIEGLVTDCNGNSVQKRIPVKPITHDVYNRLVQDPFNKSYEEEILRLANEGKFELIGNADVTIQTYHLRYLRQPLKVDLANLVNSELPEHAHQEVVDLAVTIALEEIESRRFKTNTLETQKQE